MKNTLTVPQGQAQFPALCRRGKTSAITRNGEVVAFIVPRRRMAGLLEQMEILANPEAMAAILRAKAGSTVDHPLDSLDEGYKDVQPNPRLGMRLKITPAAS